ncbi:PEP-CTERM system histidine kinase PrsK [Vibrio sp. TH_r3]|uniref:XrtA/PEP-CTERM system histidine kinase PrsK n=1 Tax=Vibrio sp. TH_r3 TaxID=3082084 RepID=UPI002955091A|nr:XrtA/PEP-CTERM system histidine kinase PrsK [Vibrio sp. TH_r3]MDV7102920.1 PEP-CTERM system histidine kinase PrsK [Vibrio sp. TH_r3]
MDILFGVAGYTLTSLGFLFLFLLLLTTKQHSLQRRILLYSFSLGSLWALSSALQIQYQYSLIQHLASETVRNLSWFLLLASALTDKKRLSALLVSDPIVRTISLFFSLILLFELAYPWLLWLDYRHILMLHLTQSVIGLWLIEQLYRRTERHHRWAIKPLCLGLGMTYAYDFSLYANALLTNIIDTGFWYGRGWVTLLTLPFILLTTRRVKHWSTRVYISRDVVYQGTLLLVAGAYLLVMAMAGYYIRYAGGNWGSAVQNIFFALSGLLLASLFLSEVLRRKLKVFITKHFYANKYEYREEWMRFASVLEENIDSPYQIALNAMIRPFDCEYGMLATVESGKLKQRACYNLNIDYKPNEQILRDLAKEAISQRWIIDINELKQDNSKIPFEFDAQQLSELSCFSYIVPIISQSGIGSACFISKPTSTHSLNWEDRDLMWAISKQLSVYLNLHNTNQTLAENQQFDTFNRMSAFLAHDLKNVLAQLQLLSKNATRHRHNPEFIDDAFETIDSSVARLTKVVNHLKKKNIDVNFNETFNLDQLVEQICTERSVSKPIPSFVSHTSCDISITTDKERFGSTIAHIIQNAQEATPNQDWVRVATSINDNVYTICIEDNGQGMSDDFVEHRLFKPFDTTKGNSGMGIGAYDAKKMIEQLGGYVEVQTSPGKGTKFLLHIPFEQNNL